LISIFVGLVVEILHRPAVFVVFDKFWVLEIAKQNLLLNIAKQSNSGSQILDFGAYCI
jgi:hypothetical protein